MNPPIDTGNLILTLALGAGIVAWIFYAWGYSQGRRPARREFPLAPGADPVNPDGGVWCGNRKCPLVSSNAYKRGAPRCSYCLRWPQG